MNSIAAGACESSRSGKQPQKIISLINIVPDSQFCFLLLKMTSWSYQKREGIPHSTHCNTASCSLTLQEVPAWPSVFSSKTFRQKVSLATWRLGYHLARTRRTHAHRGHWADTWSLNAIGIGSDSGPLYIWSSDSPPVLRRVHGASGQKLLLSISWTLLSRVHRTCLLYLQLIPVWRAVHPSKCHWIRWWRWYITCPDAPNSPWSLKT